MMRGIAGRIATVDRLPVLLAAALRWWILELWGMVPVVVRKALVAEKGRITLDVQGEDVIVGHAIGGAWHEIQREPVAEIEISAKRIASNAILRAALGRGERAIGRVPSRDVLRRTIHLPVATSRDLRNILRFELDRQSPIDPEQIRFDYRVIATDTRAKNMTVELLMTRREKVDLLSGIAASLGVKLAKVTIDDGPATEHVNFIDAIHRPFRLTLRQWVSAGLTIIVMGLAIAALDASATRQQRELDYLRAQIAEAKSSAQAVERVKQDVSTIRDRLSFLTQLKQKPAAIRAFNELTRIIPDNTWIYQLEWDGTKIRAHGYSTAAMSLIGVVDGSTLLGNAQFASPLTKGPRGDAERFDLTMDVNAGAKR